MMALKSRAHRSSAAVPGWRCQRWARGGVGSLTNYEKSGANTKMARKTAVTVALIGAGGAVIAALAGGIFGLFHTDDHVVPPKALPTPTLVKSDPTGKTDMAPGARITLVLEFDMPVKSC